MLAAVVAALLVVLGAFLWLRESSHDASARPDASTATVEESSSLRPPTSSASAERESLPVSEAAPAVTPTSEVVDDSAPRVVVVVRDSDAVPVPGAEVEITGQGQLGGQGPLGKWKCNAEGRCKLPVEPWTGGLDLRVTAKGFVTRSWSGGRKEEIVLGLWRAVDVHGRVVAADNGLPVSGARVDIGVLVAGEPEQFVFTDSNGKFELHGLPLNDDWPWWVSADGFASVRTRLKLTDPAQDIVLELARGRPLELLVVDALSDTPIEGATIGEAITNALGRASTTALMSVDDEELELLVRAPWYCSLRAPIRATTMDLTSTVRLPLLLGARLEGLVVDLQGQPVPDVDLSLDIDFSAQKRSSKEIEAFKDVVLPEGWRLEGRQRARMTTDTGGRFHSGGLEPMCALYRLGLSRGGVELSAPREVAALGPSGSTTQTRLTIDLTPPCVVTGTMALNGAPTKGFVAWRGPTRGGGELAGLDGRFRLQNVEPGHVVLTPMPNGFIRSGGDCTLFPGPWTVEAPSGGEVQADLSLELEMAAISGCVVDATGVPQAGIHVVAVSSDGGCWAGEGAADEKGCFEFSVRAGQWHYRVEAGKRPNTARQDDVLAGTRDLQLVLPGSGSLRFRAVDSSTRTTLTRFALWIEDERGESRTAVAGNSLVADTQGWFTVDLKPGPYRLFASDLYSEPTLYLPVDAGTVLIKDTEVQQVEIPRERGLELDVQLAEGQQPWPKEVVVLLLETATSDQVVLDKSGWTVGQAYRGISVVASRNVYFDPGGHTRITALRPGPHRFIAFPDTIAIEPTEVVVTGHEIEPLKIHWKAR